MCLSDADEVWLMLHSGSRNIGKELAERHIAVARALPHNQRLVDRDLAVFLAGSKEMDAYRHDLTWAQEYAARNRAVMLTLVMQAFRQSLPGRTVRFDEPISCHHNYVSEEIIDGEPMLVTRKGAIRAGRGDLGLIPGLHGHRFLRGAGPGLRAVLQFGVTRGGTDDEPHEGEEAFHRRRPRAADVRSRKRGDRARTRA